MWKIQILGPTLIGDGKAVSYDLPPLELPYRPIVGEQWLCCAGIVATVEMVTWHPNSQTLRVFLDDEVDVSRNLGVQGWRWLDIHKSMLRHGWVIDDELWDKCPSEIRDFEESAG